MNSVTFNSIVDILEAEFLLGHSAIRPEATLAELGLDSLASREFINAVEDAFRLCIPPRRLDARIGGMALRALCELIDDLQRPPVERNPAGQQVKREFAFP
jgi:acyl carrier protein